MFKRITLSTERSAVDVNGIVNFLNDVCDFFEFRVGEAEVFKSESVLNSTHKGVEKQQSADLKIVYTDKPYYNNYFFEEHDGVCIVSFYGWSDLTKISQNNGAAYFVADILVLQFNLNFRHTLDSESKPDCLFDFLEDKRGIDLSMRASYICPDCNKRISHSIKSNQNKEKAYLDIKNLLNEIGNASKWDNDLVKFWREKNSCDGSTPPKFFVSYSHSDSKWLEKLKIYLKPLHRDSVIDVWEDTRIQMGSEWKNEIRNALESCDAAILLLSAHFFASDFIVNNELPEILKGIETKGTGVFILVVRPCVIDDDNPLFRFQFHNDVENTICELSEGKQERMFVDFVSSIKNSLQSAKS